MSKCFPLQLFPIANAENVVFFEDYRITVLNSRLFRIESDPTRQFNDCATQSIWFRNMPPQKFTEERTADAIRITTEDAALVVSARFEESKVILDGRELPLSNTENLLGTARTLDCYDGEVNIRDGSRLKLGNGVCSANGVAVLDDTASLRLSDSGTLSSPSSDLFDFYVFAFGKDYRAAVCALYSVCGNPPMLPRFAFGNWWSRYHAYSAEEYLHLMDRFEEEQIPMTVATLDIDWHYSSNVDEEKGISAQGKNTLDRGCLPTPENKKIGWTGYSWNQNLFPDYRAFLKELRAKKLRVTLNLHPSSGVRYYEDMYPEMAKAMGVDPASEKPVPFNISDPKFVEAYFRILHHPYEKDGVDFWWIDWQQGTVSGMDGLDPLWALNHYHYLDNGRNHRRPLIMSRYAGIGSHRYPIGFSGDTSISWETLRLMPRYTATASNVGYTWWGHDIGGHHLGTKDDELYLRFLQFGVFNPINRMHCTDSPILTKEPWAYENGIGDLAKKMLVLRHRLIPFLYTCNYITSRRGLALCEPLYYAYPDSPESYEYKNEYLFGQSLLVAPVTEHSKENGLSETEVWLPNGTWTDFFTGEVYRVGAGGARITAIRPLDSIPVFAREGSVVVFGNDPGNDCGNPRSLEARIYNGTGDYSLFEDSGKGEVLTVFRLSETEGCQSVTISSEGTRSVIPKGRSLLLTFPNIVINHPADCAFGLRRERPTVTVLKNGCPCGFRSDLYAEVRITIDHYDPDAVYEVCVGFEPISRKDEILRSVIHRLQKTQGTFSARGKLLKKFAENTDPMSVKAAVEASSLSDICKKRLTELILPE